ncbi:MAG: type II toxin-antitoxin system YafQ family toxin [Deltaproteobacteria bacterium]|nr:type II toxin-antitoxin system YafQ family toxin [Deltaproteobacteria bacterium]
MFQLVFTNRFRKDVKLVQKRGFEMDLLKNAINSLEKSGELPGENRPHKLSGDYSGFWEAHLKPDWLIIWKVIPEDNVVWLIRTGTHADLF